MKFRITSLNIDEIIKTSFFRVDYLIESDKNEVINTRVSIYDPFFNIEHTPGSMDVPVSTNSIYWVGFDVDKLANYEKILWFIKSTHKTHLFYFVRYTIVIIKI